MKYIGASGLFDAELRLQELAHLGDPLIKQVGLLPLLQKS